MVIGGTFIYNAFIASKNDKYRRKVIGTEGKALAKKNAQKDPEHQYEETDEAKKLRQAQKQVASGNASIWYHTPPIKRVGTQQSSRVPGRND